MRVNVKLLLLAELSQKYIFFHMVGLVTYWQTEFKHKLLAWIVIVFLLEVLHELTTGLKSVVNLSIKELDRAVAQFKNSTTADAFLSSSPLGVKSLHNRSGP